MNRAYDELGELGRFENGVFHRNLGGGKRNLDGYEAIWRHLTGAPLVFPSPRYSEPVIMKPAHFSWRRSSTAGTEQRPGRFSDRGTEVTVYRLATGKGRVLPGKDHLRVVFVMKGRENAVANHTCAIPPSSLHPARQQPSPPRRAPSFCMTIPSLAAMELKAV